MNSYEEMLLPDFYDLENHTVNFTVYEYVAGQKKDGPAYNFLKYNINFTNGTNVRSL